MKPSHFAYPIDLIERIGAYLMTRPYQEVHQLIAGLQQQANPVEIKDPEEAADGQ